MGPCRFWKPGLCGSPSSRIIRRMLERSSTTARFIALLGWMPRPWMQLWLRSTTSCFRRAPIGRWVQDGCRPKVFHSIGGSVRGPAASSVGSSSARVVTVGPREYEASSSMDLRRRYSGYSDRLSEGRGGSGGPPLVSDAPASFGARHFNANAAGATSPLRRGYLPPVGHHSGASQGDSTRKDRSVGRGNPPGLLPLAAWHALDVVPPSSKQSAGVAFFVFKKGSFARTSWRWRQSWGWGLSALPFTPFGVEVQARTFLEAAAGRSK